MQEFNKPFADLTQTDFENVYKVNVLVSLLTMFAFRFLKGSHVVTISSGRYSRKFKVSGLSCTVPTRRGDHLSELLAEEYKEQGIACVWH
jgi:NAD(P)-dependent dehydrogenase (short-subunit alcohol dehydrogenase family)